MRITDKPILFAEIISVSHSRDRKRTYVEYVLAGEDLKRLENFYKNFDGELNRQEVEEQLYKFVEGKFVCADEFSILWRGAENNWK